MGIPFTFYIRLSRQSLCLEKLYIFFVLDAQQSNDLENVYVLQSAQAFLPAPSSLLRKTLVITRGVA